MKQLHIFIIFTVILVSWNLDASAQNVNFPDANLAAKVRSVLNLPTDADIPLTSLQSLTSLNASKSDVTDITGLEHATGLTFLSLHKNYNINNISALSNLTSLQILALGYNKISDISMLSNLTSLTQFNIEFNQISDIRVMSNFTVLMRSNLNGNPISNFNPLSSLTSLTILYLQETQISNLAPLSSLTNLQRLYLQKNRISNLGPLSSLTKLEFLYLDDNNISDISVVAGLSELGYLYFPENKIRDISPISGLTNLLKLEIQDNQISDLSPISELTKLTHLNVCYNEFDDISPLQSLAALTDFWIDHQFHLDNPGLLVQMIQDYWTSLSGSRTHLCPIRPDPPLPDPPPEPEPESEPEPKVKHRKVIMQCGLGWTPQSQYQHWGELSKVMIYALEFEYDPESHGRYICKTIEIRTGDDSIENLAGWNLYLGTLYNPSRIPMTIPEEHSQITGRILRITPEMLGLETFPCNTVNGISHPLPGVQYVLKTDENVLVDTAYSCFVWGQNAYTTVNGVNVKSKRQISSAALREMETPRLERYISNNIGVFITYMDIEAFTWDRMVLSDWLLAASELSAPGAPSAIQRKLVTTWGALKK